MSQSGKSRDPNALPVWVGWGYVLIGALCVPWYFSEDAVEPTLWAFPFWAAVTVGAFFVLAAYTSFIYLKVWQPDPEEEDSSDAETSS